MPGFGRGFRRTGARRRAGTASKLAYGTRVALLGDSIMQQNTYGLTSGSTQAGKSLQTADGGELTWAYAVDPRFNCDNWPDATKTQGTSGFIRYSNGSNQGYSGETSTQCLARVTDVTSLNCGVVYVCVGVNDNNGVNNIALATTKSNIQAIVDAIITSGKKVILAPPRPELRAAYVVDGANIWTWMQTTFGSGTSYASNVALCDTQTPLLADGPVANDFRDSDLHPGAYGAQAVALGTDLSVPSTSLLGCIRQLIDSGNAMTDLLSRTSYGTNPTLTGSGGTVTGATSGTVATSWGFVRTTGTASTGVASVTSNSGTGGQTQILTITPSGSSLEEYRFQLASALSGASATACQNKWMVMIAEVEVDGNPVIGCPYVQLTCSDGNYIGGGMRLQVSASNNGSRRLRPAALRYYLRSEPILMPATLTSVQTAVWFPIINANGTTPAVIKIHQVRLIEYGDPRTAWGF